METYSCTEEIQKRNIELQPSPNERRKSAEDCQCLFTLSSLCLLFFVCYHVNTYQKQWCNTPLLSVFSYCSRDFHFSFSHSFPFKNVNIPNCCINHSNCHKSEACDQELMKRQSLRGVFQRLFSSVLLRKTIAFSFLTFWWLLRSFFIMTDYDYLCSSFKIKKSSQW